MLDVDAALRPEGKNGPLVRSLAAYRRYYERWSLVWEAQALLRARPVAGDADLAERFLELIAPIRWPQGGLRPDQVREIRTLKARMEAERLPRGADRKTHFKLGHGGLSDVEWCVQLVQLDHAAANPELRTTSTLDGLAAAERLGIIDEASAAALGEAWRLASQMRNAGSLFRRPADRRPPDRPARRRGDRPDPRPRPPLRAGARRALPAGGPTGPPGRRARLLRRLTVRDGLGSQAGATAAGSGALRRDRGVDDGRAGERTAPRLGA